MVMVCRLKNRTGVDNAHYSVMYLVANASEQIRFDKAQATAQMLPGELSQDVL